MIKSFLSVIIRKRNRNLIMYTAIAVGLWIITDPDLGYFQNMRYGAPLLSMLTAAASVVFFILAFHIVRKVLFDYPEADFRSMLKLARKSSAGAGMAAIAIGLMMLAISIIIAAVVFTL